MVRCWRLDHEPGHENPNTGILIPLQALRSTLMNRRLELELLDELPAEDPRAARSRQDLQKLNAWMRHAKIMANALRSAFNGQAAQRILEIGAGDGRFMLSVVRKLGCNGNEFNPLGAGAAQGTPAPGFCVPSLIAESGALVAVATSSPSSPAARNGACATMLDRQSIVSAQTVAAFEAQRWCAEPVQADVFEWLAQPTTPRYDAMIANLFLHHFSDRQLLALLRGAARQAKVFIALEPRRSVWSLTFSRLAGLIGCNDVTRHDAVISVRAGFTGVELSQLWPAE